MYIQGLKENQDSLNLFAVLREAVTNYNSFADLSKVTE